MASSYLPSWLHLPAIVEVRAVLHKTIIIGHAALIAAGLLSAAYILQDVFRYYFLVKFENRGTLSANPGVYIFSGLTRVWRYVFGMDGTNTKPIHKYVKKTKIAHYKKKFLKEGELPVKRGPRPEVLIQAFPHRQIAQVLDPALNAAVEDHIRSLGAAHPSEVTVGPSKVEPFALALFISPTVSPNHPDLRPHIQTGISSLEFVHNHASENSLHIILSPLDCAEAVEKGWAVKFPLSGTGIPYMDQPVGRCMIYAPRDMEEVKIVNMLVDKSLEWMMSKP